MALVYGRNRQLILEWAYAIFALIVAGMAALTVPLVTHSKTEEIGEQYTRRQAEICYWALVDIFGDVLYKKQYDWLA